jgi:hypothetical protein
MINALTTGANDGHHERHHNLGQGIDGRRRPMVADFQWLSASTRAWSGQVFPRTHWRVSCRTRFGFRSSLGADCCLQVGAQLLEAVAIFHLALGRHDLDLEAAH